MSILRWSAAGLVIGAVMTSGAEAQRPTTKLPARPAASPAKPFTYPAFTLDTLPNGLRFAVVENHELPIVIVRSAFGGVGPLGVWFQDPAGKAGAWGMLLMNLREGTPTRSNTQITDEIADLGSDFFMTASTGFVPPWFRSAKSTWVPSLHLLSDMLVNATIPADRFDRLQTTTAATLDRLPVISQANRLLYTALYGPTSEYNHFATSASLKALTRDDVLAMKRAYLGPQNTLFVIAGDVTRAEARRALVDAFGKWERSTTTIVPVIPKAPATPAPTAIYVKDVPGQMNPMIVSGQTLPGRDHADGAAIEALASVLGDFGVGAGSRVYRAFRTERGLAYAPGVSLGSRPLQETVVLSGNFTVPPTTVDTAVNLWLQVIRDLKGAKPVLVSELEFSKNNLIGKLPLDMERLDGITFNVIASLRDRLPPAYLNHWVTRVSGLSVASVQAVAARHLDPEHMPIIVMGDRSKIEAALRATGIPVVIIEK